jgi:hypothetical protein
MPVALVRDTNAVYGSDTCVTGKKTSGQRGLHGPAPKLKNVDMTFTTRQQQQQTDQL